MEERDMKKFIDEIGKEKKDTRDKEYLDFMVKKFCWLENHDAMGKNEYSSIEEEAFIHGFYVSAGSFSAAIEKWLKKDGDAITTSNKAQETFESLVGSYPTKAEVERLKEFYDEMKSSSDEKILNPLKTKISTLEEGYEVRSRLEEQFNRGKKYGSFFGMYVPGVGLGYTGMEIGKYIKDGGYEHIYERGKDGIGFLAEKTKDGFGKLKDMFKKKKDEEE